MRKQIKPGFQTSARRLADRLFPLSEFIALSLLVTITAAQSAWAQNTFSSHDQQQIEKILNEMTLEEKIRMLYGGDHPGVSQLPGVPRLGIPPILPSDGPRGMTATQDTAFPSGLGQAMSWDPALFEEIGKVIGQETRAAGRTMVFAPAINTERDPLNGRFFEYLTEDPFLDGQLAVPMVQGIQQQRVAACVKHFVANDRETNRDWYMSDVDERTLEEIQLPAFKEAVQKGGAWAVMTAANGLNGDLAAQNRWLLTTTLKEQWGFKGLVLTDYNHARATEKAAFAGLDISMPWGDWKTESFAKPLMDEVMARKIPESLINDKVRRILGVMKHVGLLDGVDPHTGGSANTPEHQAVARSAAEESLVLLKNESHTLPLAADKIRHIIVVGPNADRYLCEGGLGGSSGVHPPYEITALAGLQKKFGSDKVEYLSINEGSSFEPIGLSVLSAYGKPGVNASYFNDGNEQPVLQRRDPAIDFNWEMRSPDPLLVHTDNFSAHYTGILRPTVTGYYSLRVAGQGSATLFLNGQPFLNNFASNAFRSSTAGIHLEAGVAYPFQLQYHATTGDASLHLEWSLPSTAEMLETSVHNAEPKLKAADAVVFVGGWNHGLDTEGLDRTNMDFPQGQAALIRSIARINPRTIVVLMHGSPFTVSGWIDSVPAVLDAWYPGMEGGTAIAEAIAGDINPAGKLTFTWPKQLLDSPTYSIGTADTNSVHYKEGVFIGYRYFDTNNITPQFPFGYGLSYSSFRFSKLKATASSHSVHVTLQVKNESSVAGAEVVQLYVSPRKPAISRPVHELKGFRRIALHAGESAQVSFTLDAGSFAYWDTWTHSPKTDPGEYVIEGGDSSRNLPLHTSLHLPAFLSDNSAQETAAQNRP